MTINVGLTVSIDRAFAGGGGGLSAPTINYPSPLAANPTTIGVHIPVDWQSGDTLNLARSANVNMTSPTVLTHAITDADIAAGTFSIGLSGVTLSGITYFDAYGTHGGVQSPNVSNIVAWGDTVHATPTITSSNTASGYQYLSGSMALTASTGGYFAIVGGTDQDQFTLAGTTLSWRSQSTAGTLKVNIQFTDYSGNASLVQTITLTLAANTPSAFSFTNVTNAALSTNYNSNSITIAGLVGGASVPFTVSAGTYSKNGGAATSTSTTVVNGDVIVLHDTSGNANNQSLTVTATAGATSANWTISTPVVLSTTTTFDPANKGASIALSNGNMTATASGTNWSPARSTTAKSGDRYAEFTVNGTAGWNIAIGIVDASAVMADGYNFGYTDAHGCAWNRDGGGLNGLATGSTGSGGYNNGTVVGVRCRPSNNTIEFYNDTSGVPIRIATGVSFPASWYLAVSSQHTDEGATLNTGHSPWAYTPPTGTQAWDV